MWDIVCQFASNYSTTNGEKAPKPLIKVDPIQCVVLHKISNSCSSDGNGTGCVFIDYVLFALGQLDLEQKP